MNGATRVKGWTVTDALLNCWADTFNAQLQTQSDTSNLLEDNSGWTTSSSEADAYSCEEANVPGS
jgi:hypothetical protein